MRLCIFDRTPPQDACYLHDHKPADISMHVRTYMYIHMYVCTYDYTDQQSNHMHHVHQHCVHGTRSWALSQQPCVHACHNVCTCIRTCVHTCVRTCVGTCVCTCVCTYMYTYMYVYVHVCVHVYVRTYLHTEDCRMVEGVRATSQS